MWQTQLECPIVDETLQPLLHAIYPLHGVQSLETWMIHGVRNVWQRVESQKFGRLRQFCAPTIQICLEIDLLSFELLLSPLAEILIIVRMEDVYDEVQVQVKLQLFRQEVASEHILRDQHLPGFKELVLLATVK